MTAPDQLVPARVPDPAPRIERAEVPLPEFNRFLYTAVGGLTAGVRQAWAMGAHRVWVHTCSLDGPTALANYRARGLRIYREETIERPDPGAPDGPWPGAR